MKLWKHLLVFLLVIIFFISNSYAKKVPEENEISNRFLLEKMELYQSINDKKFELVFNELKKLREDMNRRFEQVYNRFEQVDKHFELLVQMNKDLREDMNKRFEQVDKRFELLVEMNNKLREDMNRRFEQVDKRFEFIQLLYIALIALTVGTPFVIESRRDKKRQKIQEKERRNYEEINKEIKTMIATFNELSRTDENIRNALKKIDKNGILIDPQQAYAN